VGEPRKREWEMYTLYAWEVRKVKMGFSRWWKVGKITQHLLCNRFCKSRGAKRLEPTKKGRNQSTGCAKWEV